MNPYAVCFTPPDGTALFGSMQVPPSIGECVELAGKVYEVTAVTHHVPDARPSGTEFTPWEVCRRCSVRVRPAESIP